jgi:hypothetical protein
MPEPDTIYTMGKAKDMGGRPRNCGNCKQIKTQCKCGRPTVITPKTVKVLEAAFMNALTDVQACLVAKIGTTALYDYCDENPTFAERKEVLKKQAAAQAKINLVESINKGNLFNSRWWLEHKERGEFSFQYRYTADVQISSIAELTASLARKRKNETDAYAD